MGCCHNHDISCRRLLPLFAHVGPHSGEDFLLISAHEAAWILSRV